VIQEVVQSIESEYAPDERALDDAQEVNSGNKSRNKNNHHLYSADGNNDK
jgi:hypothetical protein